MCRLVFLCTGPDYYNFVYVQAFWFYYAYLVACRLAGFSLDFVFLSQICEWLAMVFVIVTQKGTNINEIWYRHQQFQSEICKKEKNLIAAFGILVGFEVFYIVSLTTIEISCTNLQNEPNTYGMISLVISLIYILAKACVFLFLMAMMKMFGNYVYIKVFRTICIYFILDFLSYGLTIWILTTYRVQYEFWSPMLITQQILYCLNIP